MTQSRGSAVIGPCYVGLPVAIAFARAGAPVGGFDIDHRRVEELRSGHDRTREFDPDELSLAAFTMTFESHIAITCAKAGR